jgi:chaperonin GroEL
MGMIAGGGSVLAKMSESNLLAGANEQQLGINIVFESCRAPLTQMCLNAGESPDIIYQKVSSSAANHGYNFMNRNVEDLFSTGVIDPVKVTISAIENATSVASTLITTNHAIVKH